MFRQSEPRRRAGRLDPGGAGRRPVRHRYQRGGLHPHLRSPSTTRLKAVSVPIVECHLSNPGAREAFSASELRDARRVRGWWRVSAPKATSLAVQAALGAIKKNDEVHPDERAPEASEQQGDRRQARRKPRPSTRKLVRRLADILKDTGLSEIEVEKPRPAHPRRPRDHRRRRSGDLCTRSRRCNTALTAAATPAAAAPSAASAPAQPEGEAGEVAHGRHRLPAGRNRARRPSRGWASTVNEGQTLLIVEAMKTMNPIAGAQGGRR